MVFSFLRAGREILAKYTHNPKFVAAPGRYTDDQLRAALDFMWKTFGADRAMQAGGYGIKQNRAVVVINVTEPEFRSLVAKKGVKIPDPVDLHFVASHPVSKVNQPLRPGIAPLVRIFSRDDRPAGILHAINSRAKIVLLDGCFHVLGTADDKALVLFPLGAQLFIDRGGYLAFGSGEAPGYAHIGEEIVTAGSITEVSAPELVEPIHAVCGPGKVVKINGMRSAAAERLQTSFTTNAESLRQLRTM